MSEETTTATTTPEPEKNFSRDEVREAILNAQPKGKELTIFGVKCILREPPTSLILDAQQNEDKKMGMGLLMTQYLYTKGGERVFDEGDVEALLAVPFSDDMRALSNAINDLMGVVPNKEDKSKAA